MCMNAAALALNFDQPYNEAHHPNSYPLNFTLTVPVSSRTVIYSALFPAA